MATTTNNGWTTPDDTDLVKDGALAIRDLGQEIDTSVGTGLLAWTAFTPTWTGLTVGNGTYNNSQYVIIGKTAHVAIEFVFGSTSAITGEVTLTLPANLARKNIYATGIFTGLFIDTGVIPFNCEVQASISDAKNYLIRAVNASGTYAFLASLSATIPFTWAATDRLVVTATFEVA
jgi:hypothetical protein